jgi:hypothetical protein
MPLAAWLVDEAWLLVVLLDMKVGIGDVVVAIQQLDVDILFGYLVFRDSG